MIIFDNSVLSAFTRLEILPLLHKLLSEAIISQEIFKEYSVQWQQTIPNWIKVIKSDENIIVEDIPLSLSIADLSIIRLAIEYKKGIASDDRPLRSFAKKLGILITGSLGLLKMLYQKGIIKNRDEYLNYLNLLQEDIFISDDLREWALK